MLLRSVFIGSLCSCVILILLLLSCPANRDKGLVGDWKALDRKGRERRVTFRDDGSGLQGVIHDGQLDGVSHFDWEAKNGVLQINSLGEEGERGSWDKFTYRIIGQKHLRINPAVLYESKAPLLERVDARRKR